MLFPKSILTLVLSTIGTLACASIASAETIRTPSFEIKITRQCAEGNISCNRVTYIGKDLNTGKSIRLKGKTVNSVNSYRFLGYEFRNGKYLYSISNNNVLRVYQGKKIVLQEQGTAIND
jgi:WD40 repeat protein